MNDDPHGLVAAAQSDDHDAIRTAAQDGGTMLDTDAQGHTALWYAAQGGRTETVQTLLDAVPVRDLAAEQAHIGACAAEAGRHGHDKALEVLGGTGAIDEPNWKRIHELAQGPARVVVDYYMAMPTKRFPSSLELGAQKMEEMRQAHAQLQFNAQQAGMTM